VESKVEKPDRARWGKIYADVLAAGR